MVNGLYSDQTHIVETKQKSIGISQLIGIAGAIILVIGVFMPIASITFIKSISENFYDHNNMQSFLMFALAAVSVIAILLRIYWIQLGAGVASLLLTGYAYFTFQNDLGVIGRMIVTMEYGWLVLAIGGLVITVSAVLGIIKK